MTSSPQYPQSNGMSERTIGTIKQLLRKADYPYIASLEYHYTPITGLKCSPGLKYSPAQILNRRRLNLRLPTAAHLLQPKVVTGVRTELLKLQEKQKYCYDHNAKPLCKLEVNDGIRIKENGVWNRVRVTASHASPRSYIVQSATGSVLCRNRCHLLKTAEPAPVVVPDFESLPVGPSLEPGTFPNRRRGLGFHHFNSFSQLLPLQHIPQ